MLQSVLAPPLFSGLKDIMAGRSQYHHCILVTLRWAVRSSLPISYPRKHESEGNPKPHAYGLQGFPAPPLHSSCPLPDSLKRATSSSLFILSPKNMVINEGNPKSHVHGIHKGPQLPPAAPTLCLWSVEGCGEDRPSPGWKFGWLGATQFVWLLEQGKMKGSDVLVVKEWERG